ncbi:MAG: hypothetical protein H7Z70_05845 [Bacteroidia bacterium]|nr:hypothetical protein [Methylotenera sp.]
MNVDNYNSLKQSLDGLLYDRNYLVHEFSKEFPLNNADNCHAAVIYLDESRKKPLSVMESIRTITNSHIEAIRHQAIFLDSDAFWSFFETELQSK